MKILFSVAWDDAKNEDYSRKSTWGARNDEDVPRNEENGERNAWGLSNAWDALKNVWGPRNSNVPRKNYYQSTHCPNVEQLIRDITWSKVAQDPTLGAKLLRIHYHDCFVKGCDASILLDKVGSDDSEKEARPNLSLAGFEVIDDIKREVESKCPGIVSCADILALVARDAVSYPFKTSMWEVETGRKDGFVSLASNVNGNLPSPFSDFATLKQIFANKGLNVDDLVALSGAHTIGVAHCGAFSRRLFNFSGKGDMDPSLNATYAKDLKDVCPNPANPATIVEMDPMSSTSFDSNYFNILINQNKGLFQSDAALLNDKDSVIVIKKLQDDNTFFSEFAKSMKKMGAIELLTGNAGEIRKNFVAGARNVLRNNFYKSAPCPNAEQLIRDITWSKAKIDVKLGARLLRLHYHDCFLRGCDESVLLDTEGTEQSEKEAVPNLSLGGFDVIDDIKKQVEAKCPGIVSCADILALSARDAVSFPFKTSMWGAETGRKDGNVSLASEVLIQLVVAHCGTFSKRLFNFSGKGDIDPSLNATYAKDLKDVCPNPANPATIVDMDPLSSTSFDSNYFNILINQNKGLFQSDAAFLNDKDSVIVIKKLQDDNTFFFEFAKSMKKMGAIEVLTGNAGQIRKNCRVKN
uniref:peroxidase n=1 Tax=Solanum lycopersicum TaxID=4081 RepID=A0A3Q7EGN4_SOLLC